MAASPSFRFAAQAAGVKYSATAGATVTASLVSTDGVSSVAWLVEGTDETRSPASYTLTPSGSVSQSVSFTAGGEGTAVILKATINGGVNPRTGNVDATMSTTAKCYVPAANGVEVIAFGENMESSSTHGWASALNPAIRLTGANTPATGAAVALAAVNTTLTSARRASFTEGAGGVPAPSAAAVTVLTNTVPNGTSNGERRTLRRDTTSRQRQRYVNADGSHIAWLNGVGAVELEWDATASKWIPLGADRRAKVFYPEDFGPNVGIGNATADTTAILAMRDALYSYDVGIYPYMELGAEVVFEAPEYLINQTVEFFGTGYTSLRFRGGGGPGFSTGARGTTIRWAGAAAKHVSGTPTFTFARFTGGDGKVRCTVTRSTGSFAVGGGGDGFAAGMRIYIYKKGGNNSRICQIESVAVDGTSIVLEEAQNTTPTVPIDTSGLLPTDEVGATGYAISEASAIVRFIGLVGFEVRDLVFMNWNAGTGTDGYTLFSVHVDIRPDVPFQTRANAFRFVDCMFYGSVNKQTSVQLAFGVPPSNPDAGSQVDTGYIRGCQFYGCAAIAGFQSSNVKFLNGNNTKVFFFRDCLFANARVGVDRYHASDQIGITDSLFESMGEAAVLNNGDLAMTSCSGERVTSIVVGSIGRTTMTNCVFNVDAAAVPIVTQAAFEAIESTFYNTHVVLIVSAIDTTTNVWTGANGAAVAPANGDEVVVRATTPETMPGGVVIEKRYWLGDVTAVGSGVYTFKIYRDGPPGTGTAVDVTTAGSGARTILSPCIFQTNDYSRGVIEGFTSIVLRSCNIGAAEGMPHIIGSSATYPTLEPEHSTLSTGTTRVLVENCVGNSNNVFRALRNISTSPTGYQGCVPYHYHTTGPGGNRTDARLLNAGVNTEGWTTYEFDYDRMKNGAQTMTHYLRIPLRCGVTRVISEVVTGFAAPGMTNLTLQVGSLDGPTATVPDPDNLLTAHSLVATAWASDLANKRWGFNDTERGVDLQGQKERWNKVTGAADYGWISFELIQVLFTRTGGSGVGDLTAGRVRLHIKCERIPPWEIS